MRKQGNDDKERRYFPEAATWDLAGWERADGTYELVHILPDDTRAVLATIKVSDRLGPQDRAYIAEFMAAAPRLWRQLRTMTPWADGSVDFPEAIRDVADATALLAEVAGFFPWSFMRPFDNDETASARSNDAAVGPGVRRRPASRKRPPRPKRRG